MKLGLVGHPVAHSRSPALHAAALSAAGLAGTYALVDHPDADTVAERFAALQREGFRGFNVTVPYKTQARAWVQRCSPLAARIGAVNTVVLDTGGVSEGHNTDAGAAVASVRALGHLPRRVLCLGTGGAARAVIAGFQAEGATVAVLGRDAGKVEALRREFGLAAAQPGADLVINATSLGMHRPGTAPVGPEPFEALLGPYARDCRVAFDLIYTPRHTPFLAWAAARGMATLDGLDMLVRQAAHAFELWTGAPRQAAHAAMAAVVGLTVTDEPDGARLRAHGARGAG